uniref:Protein SHORTAGE IN CHIASMATA 1 n=1 Tax=Chenopodium quinoa TaxID=63459 RepID=A0A803M0E2_CHEQI
MNFFVAAPVLPPFPSLTSSKTFRSTVLSQNSTPMFFLTPSTLVMVIFRSIPVVVMALFKLRSLMHAVLKCQDCQLKEAGLYYEEMEAHRCSASDSVTLENQYAKDTVGEKNYNKAEIIQFEAPELTQFMEDVCMSEKEVQLLSEVQDCDVDLGLLNLVPTDPFGFDVKDPMKSVDSVCLEYDMTPKLQVPDDVGILPDNIDRCGTSLPLLEVEEIGPVDISNFCLESLFATIEEQHSACSIDLEHSCQELFVSVEIDILEHISDNHSSKPPLEICFTSLSLDIDLLQVVETPYREEDTGSMDGPIAFVDTFLFEEFKMLDSDSLEIFEVNAVCQTTEAAKLCNMFPEDLPFRSFDELIVNGELAIIDGTFTSLSVPDLVDDENIWSLHVIFDKLLAELEPVPLSTSDEIYLDWHLLGRDECNGDVNAAIEKLFSDIDDYTMDLCLKSDDGNMVVLDFVLSNGPSDGLNIRENKVIMPSGVSCTEKHLINEVVSRKSPGEDCQIIENIGNLTNADFENFTSSKLSDDDCQIIENIGICGGDLHNVDSSVESMPQFNDLDFFLNPTSSTGGMRIGNKVKPLDAKSLLSARGQKKETASASSIHMQQFDACEGVIATSSDRDTAKLEALLNYGPVQEKCNKVSSGALNGTNTSKFPIPVCSTAQESEPAHLCESSHEMPIIINTQDFDKDMIISRRSTYQKILTMEKKGVQVVERDLILPVDIIINSTACIVWYDYKNIGKKTTAQDEGASCVPLCIENIAANVLTSLSFAFTNCVLIFEGDCNFLGPVMESADELYAAAASLGTYLQIFYSSSFELTDETILNYIRHSRNIYKGLLSRLPDSETLAESFFTKFPSINPLSAHAIISSGCILLEFLELTVEGRIQILRKNHVPEESVYLFSFLCKFGEREESKSGLTDCSSSVSSPPDSGKFVCNINSDDRKRKFNASSCDAMYDFRCSMPSKHYAGDEMTDQDLLRPSDPKVSQSPRICLQKKMPNFLLDSELFHEGEAPDAATNMDPSKAWCETYITEEPKIHRKDDGFARYSLIVNEGFSSQQKSSRIKSKREQSARDILQDLHEDFVGEVVNIYDKSLFGGDFQIDEKTVKSSPMASEIVKDHAPRYNRTARRLSFGNSPDRNVSVADVMDTRCILEDSRQLRNINSFNGVEYNWSNDLCKASQKQQETARIIQEKSMQNFSGQLSEGKTVPPYGETPLSKAIHSGKLQQGSPWTIEFLNRVKEKRKLRQQYQPNASVPRTNYHGDITKSTKRRSPSILEYYKYQGDSMPRKMAEQKMQKQHAQLRNERSQGFRPICTPIDKKARRSLSFATSGTGSQTKLVWSDNLSFSQDSRFSTLQLNV